MGQEIRFKLKRGAPLTRGELAMLEAARNLPPEYDEDNPEIDPVSTPEQYSALIQAVGERNRRIAESRRGLA